MKTPVIAVMTWGLALSFAGCTDESKGSSPTPTTKDAGPARKFEELLAYDWNIDPGVETYFCGYQTLTEDLYIDAFRPLMPTGTHHVFLGYQDPAVPDAYVPAVEGATPSPTTCTGTTAGDILAFGAGVGTEELAMPQGVAVKIPAGKQLVFSLHLINVSQSPLKGHSGIAFAKPDPSAVRDEAEVIAAGKFADLTVPPGKSTQTGSCEMVDDVSIFAVMPHMHLTGVHMTTTAETVDGNSIPLLDTDYDFADQRYTVLPKPVALKKGDKMRIACEYENAGPNALGFGESTNKNEMCITFAYRYPAVSMNTMAFNPTAGRGSSCEGSTIPVGVLNRPMPPSSLTRPSQNR